MLVALFATLIGAGLGAALPFVIASVFGALIPLPVAPSLHPGGARAVDRLWPADGAGLCAVAARTRPRHFGVDAVPRPGRRRADAGRGRRYVVATALIVAALAALAVLFAYDRRLAAIFVGAAAVVFVALRLVAMLMMAIARRLPRTRSTLLRLAIANIHRPGALTPSVVLSLGLGLSLAGHGDRDRRQSASPVHGGAAGKGAVVLLPRHPVGRRRPLRRLRARACAARRRSSACRCCAAASSPRTASRPRTSSPAKDRPGCCAATAASPMRRPSRQARASSPANGGRPTMPARRSSRSKTGRPTDLNLKLGDTVTVNVLGRNVTARIANLRAVDWQSLGINFVLVFSPGTFAGAPHTDIATLTFTDGGTPAEETALHQGAGRRLPHGLRGARQGRARCGRPSRQQSGRWRCAARAR